MSITFVSAVAVLTIFFLGVTHIARAHHLASKSLVVAGFTNTLLLAFYLGQVSAAFSWLGFWQAAPLVLMAAVVEPLMRQRSHKLVAHGTNIAAVLLAAAALGQSVSAFWFRRFAPELGEPNVTWLLSPVRNAFIAAVCALAVGLLWLAGMVASHRSKPAA